MSPMRKKAILLSVLAAVVVIATTAYAVWRSQSEDSATAVALPNDATDPAAGDASATGGAGAGAASNPISATDTTEFQDNCSFHPPAGPSIDATKVKDYKFDHEPSDRKEVGRLEDGTAFSLRVTGCEDFLTEELSFEAPAGETHPTAAWLSWWRAKMITLPLVSQNSPQPAAQALSLIETRLGELHSTAAANAPAEFMICMNGTVPGGSDCKDLENKSVTCPTDCGWDDGGAGVLKIEKTDSGTTRVTVSESTSA